MSFRWILTAVILIGLTLGLGSQTTQPASPPGATPLPILNPGSNIPEGEPYEEGEFDSFWVKLQRAEVITVGAFPFAVMLSGLGYDYWYWTDNDFDSLLVPWPAGKGTSNFTGDLLNAKNTSVLWMGLGLSLSVAVLDWVLGLEFE